MNPRIEIEDTLDWEAIWEVFHHPSIFDRVCDDVYAKMPLHELKAIIRGMVENPHNHSLLVSLDDHPVGCFTCYHMGDGVFEIHTMLTDKCRGSDAIAAGKMGTQHMLSMPDVQKLYSVCPANLPESYLFARYCGWHRGVVSPRTWIKNGVEYPMKIVEITKADLKEAVPCH